MRLLVQGLPGGAGKQHLTRIMALEHALNVQGNEKFFLDDEDSAAIEHIESVRNRGPVHGPHATHCHLSLTCLGTYRPLRR